MRIALLLIASLLAGCGMVPDRREASAPFVRVETHEVEVPAFRPLPAMLTAQVAMPAVPPPGASNEDKARWCDAVASRLEYANLKFGLIESLQPMEADGGAR
jgi:hypothetical protein